MVVGSSGFGNTYLVSQLVTQHREFFIPCFEQFVHFYNQLQPVYQDLQLALAAEKFFFGKELTGSG